jgi:hypothetical protein
MMKEEVAVATSGVIPISSITGPLTMPDPMPRNPAAVPPIVPANGIRKSDFTLHCTSPSCSPDIPERVRPCVCACAVVSAVWSGLATNTGR